MMLVLALGSLGPAPSRVMTHVRRAGLTTREELARRTGLSGSSVTRTVTALTQAGLLRERPDLAAEGAVGRPSIPLEVDVDQHVTLGCHVGRRTVTVALGDLRGRVLARTMFPTPAEGASALARRVASELTAMLAQHSTRMAISAGLVAPWGDIDFDREELGSELAGTLGLEVETWELIPAIAAAEYIARPEDLPGSTLYLYARETVGFVMANQRPTGTEIARVGRLSHFPAGGVNGCRCGRTGCLEGVVSEHALARAAHAAGLVGGPEIELVHSAALAGDDAAHQLLRDRAEVLGRVAAVVRDMVNPDRVVLCGQAFTGYPPALDVIRTSLRQHTATRAPIDISFTRLTGEIQAVAAGTVALRRVYDDPLGVVAEEADSSDNGRCASG
jgi:predicted NBD/HSP70 family sugar kinase